MFCSLCMVSEGIHDCKRRICPVGHVACESCDVNLGKCPECDMKYCNYVCVQFVHNVPRLFILEPTSETSVAASTCAQGKSIESDSLQNILDQLNAHEINQQQEPNIIDISPPRSVYGCFEIVEPQPSLISIPVDGDEEREIMKCFKIYDKSPPNVAKDGSGDGMADKKSENLTKAKSVQTLFVERAVGHPIMSLKRNSQSNQSTINRVHVTSQDYYPVTGSSIHSDKMSSVYEIFKNSSAISESDTAHFTPLTISSVSSSPPDSPPKIGVNSLAHRVKFASFYHVENRIPLQMEPMTIYEAELSEAELPSDRSRKLSRFPVRCPVTNCDMSTVPSDFCNHITIDHPHVDSIRVAPRKAINMRLSHKGNSNMITCQRLFLITEKMKEIGYGNFENCLPVLFLTAKMTMRKAFGCTPNPSSFEHLFVFFAGVYQFPMNYSITLFTHGRDDSEPTIIKSMSNSVRFMNHPFSLKDIAKNAFVITALEIQKLSNNGRNLLTCQIVFH